MDTELEQRLNSKIKRADRIIFGCMIGLLILVVVLFSGIMYQNQKNFDLSRIQVQQSQVRTQEYIKCVAETLTKPLLQRSDNALDVCTNAADSRTKGADIK